MNRRLARFLRRAGVAPAEMDRAEAEGWLTLLTLDRLLLPGAPRYATGEIATAAQFDDDTSKRLWRALGFPDARDDERMFTDEAIDMLGLIKARFQAPLPNTVDPAETLVQQVRAVSAGLSRVAEVISDQMAEVVEQGRAAGMTDVEMAETMLDGLDWPTLARLSDYALRLQVRAAMWRKLGTDGDEHATSLAVGFLDLVGYTAISQELEDQELAALVARFEAVTHDTVAQLGGRMVKTIGDEVMLVADDPSVAALILLRLTEKTDDDELLPPARAGLAFGPVLAREGDYYGPVVNLAHRLVEVARPGTVIVSDAVRDALGDDARFGWSRMRSRRIRDIGRVGTFALRAGDARIGEGAAGR